LHSQIQQLDPSRLSQDVLSRAGSVLKARAVGLVSNAAAAAPAATATVTAAKSDTAPAGAESLVARPEPVPEQHQQQQQQQLLAAHANLGNIYAKIVLFQKQELTRTEVHSAVTAAIGSSTGTSVLLRGPVGCGKSTALRQVPPDVTDWCKQQAQLRPASVPLSTCDVNEDPAGVYGAILRALMLTNVSKHTTTAKQQLEALLFKTSDSSSSSSRSSHVRMIIVRLESIDFVDKQQVKQLLEWAHTDGCRLILIGTAYFDLGQNLPRPQHLVVLKQFTESDVLAVLTAQAGAAVLRAAYVLCTKYARGDVERARRVCLLATKLALSDHNKSSVVTVSHMEQAVRMQSHYFSSTA
jgi:AAA domain